MTASWATVAFMVGVLRGCSSPHRPLLAAAEGCLGLHRTFYRGDQLELEGFASVGLNIRGCHQLLHSPFDFRGAALAPTLLHYVYCTYVYIYVYVYKCIKCIHVYMYTCIYVYMYICIYVYVYMCIYVCMYTCIYVYMYERDTFRVYLTSPFRDSYTEIIYIIVLIKIY